MELVSKSEYARRRGCSAAYISKLVRQGKLATIGDKIDPIAADAALNATRERVRVPFPEKPTTTRLQDSLSRSYLAAKTANETYKAKLQRLEFELKTGKLLQADKVLESAEKAFSTVRVRMRGLAKSMAPILAAQNRPGEIEKILSEAIDGALEGLSQKVFG
jgi:hypothetical protein